MTKRPFSHEILWHRSHETMWRVTAMHLLQAGVDMAVIALWLGHESIETTHIYVEADLALKQRALVSDAELFANRSALFANGGKFRYAPL
jgi:integrase